MELSKQLEVIAHLSREAAFEAARHLTIEVGVEPMNSRLLSNIAREVINDPMRNLRKIEQLSRLLLALAAVTSAHREAVERALNTVGRKQSAHTPHDLSTHLPSLIIFVQALAEQCKATNAVRIENVNEELVIRLRVGPQFPLDQTLASVLPPSECSHAQLQSQSAKKPLAMQTSKQPCVLAVATEWDSKHGGLSTFNRDLCSALAAAGARVVCYVPQASSAEVERAKAVRVALVEAPKMPGAESVALLFQRPNLPADFVPNIVIGHDRITGAASVALARDHYSASKRVLFIHTSPEEIEWHKEPREDSTTAERAAARKREQLGLANGCDLVVAVGPHLASEIGTDLHGAGNAVSTLELTPGLPERPPNQTSALPPSIRCLILGRVEDYYLKGLDLAAKAFARVVANWKQGNPPKLVVRGAPVGTDEALRKRLAKDSAPTTLDIVVRHYSADETEIRNDLREASLVLMPSKKEGFGLVGLEAIACGIPTLISASSGLAETVKFHAPQLANEWILPVTGDAVAKWAERIEYLLAGREGAFARATALREELAGKLSWQRPAAELLQKLSIPKT